MIQLVVNETMLLEMIPKEKTWRASQGAAYSPSYSWRADLHCHQNSRRCPRLLLLDSLSRLQLPTIVVFRFSMPHFSLPRILSLVFEPFAFFLAFSYSIVFRQLREMTSRSVAAIAVLELGTQNLVQRRMLFCPALMLSWWCFIDTVPYHILIYK